MERYKKIVKYKGAEELFVPLILFGLVLFGHLTSWGFILLIFVMLSTFPIVNRHKIKVEVYWQKMKDKKGETK